MDFIDHAKIMIPELTGLPVTVWNGDSRPLEEFEKQFCFLPEIQELYTAKGLLSFFERKDGSHIYVISEPLDTRIAAVKIDGQWVILGPYITSAWQDTGAKVLLAGCGVKDENFLPFKLYRCGLPMLEQGFVIRTAVLLLKNTVGNLPPRELEMIQLAVKNEEEIAPRVSEQYDEIELVNRRYAIENQIIEAVQQGRTTEALELEREMFQLAKGLRFVTADMKDQIAGAAILRVLVRHAALRAGLMPVVIDSLSQEFAQKMHHASDEQQIRELVEQYIVSFCYAIRANQKGSYSIYVKRAVQYIETHLSQPVSADTLCQLSGISRKHFVQLFSKETGRTVKQYAAQARCARAAELLENSQLPVQEISSYVGYEDNNYFTKVFKSIMGMSPQEYRKTKTFYKI